MPTKYWRVGGTNTWSATANWSTVSPTGATGAAIPVVGDDVVIDSSLQGGGTINIGATATAKLNSWTVIGAGWTVAGATQVNVAGTFDCRSVTWTNTGLLSLQGTGGSYDINTSGTTFSCPVTFNALNVASSSFNLLSAFTTGATQTTTLTAGTLILNNFTLTTGIFSSGATNVREIQFGTGNIALIHTTAGTAVVALANYSNFSCSGTGGFTSAMSVTRTFTFGSTGATNTNSPNLALTSGASIPTFAASSWFNTLNFTGSTCIPATVTVNVMSLTLASGGTYTALTVNTIDTGTITPAGKSLAAFTVNHTGTTTLAGALSVGVTGTTTLTQGTLDLAGFTLTTGAFSSTNANTRAITFGTGAIALSHTTAATTVLSMATATGFTWTGTGGFTVADMAVTRTFSFGSTAGGTTTNAPNLTFTTGASVATLTTAGWFNTLNFGTTGFAIGTTSLNVNSLTLSSTGTYTSLTATMVGTGTINYNTKSTGPLTINSAGTTTVAGGGVSCTTFTRTAGTIDFATFSLTCTNSLTGDTDLFAPAGTVNLNTITCPTYTVNGTATMTSGQSLTATTSFVTATAFIFNGGTLTTPLFTHTSGTVTLGANLSPGVTGTYTLTAGTLNLAGFTLTTGIFSSSNANTRDIAFGTGNIALSHTTAATTVLSMATLTGFTYTGTGGFTVAAMSNTRTFTCGSGAGGSSNIAPNLTFTSGASIATITTASWFNKLDFGTTGFAIGTTTLNVNSITLSSGGTYTALTATMVGTGTITSNGKTLAAFTVNHTGTTTLADAFSVGVTGTTTLTQGTLDLAGFNLTTGIFSSNNSNTRAIAFGTSNIVLSHTTAATTVLSMATATAFTWTGTGGFTVADMINTRTFSFGSTTGGTTSNAPNLTFTTGASIATITTASWFNTLNFGTTGFTIATTSLNVNSLTLSSTSTYTLLSATMVGTGTITTNGKTIAAFTVNHAGTTTVAVSGISCTTFTRTAGTIDFVTFSLTCTNSLGSDTDLFAPAGTVNLNTITCLTYTVNGTVTMTSGQSITTTTSFVTATAFIFNGGTLTTPLFSHTSGTVTLGANLSPGVTGTYTLTQGTLDLVGFTLTTGIFSSNNSNTRAIAFGTGNIVLSHTTAATTVLVMNDLTGFTYTGTGGFTVAAMSNTRTFTCGTTSGSGTTSNAPNLTFTSGASVATITTASWFNKLDYGTTSFTQAAATLNVNSITLSSGGTYTALILNLVGSGTLTYNGKTTAAVTLLAGSPTIAGTVSCTTFTVNGGAWNFTTGTLTPSTSFVLTSGSFTYNGGTLSAVPTFTQNTAGTTATFNFSYSLAVTGTYSLSSTLILADGVTLSTGIFSSSMTTSRSIAFGSASAGNINLTHTTAGTRVLNMAYTTNLSVTGPGGFTVNAMSVARTFVCGTQPEGVDGSNAVNLTFTTGASVATIESTYGAGVTTASSFKSLNFGTTAFALPSTASTNGAGVTIYGDLILSSTGTYTAFQVSMVGTGTITPNGKTLGATTVNTTGTITLAGALVTGSFTMTTGTLDCAFFNLGRATTESFTYSAGTILNMGTLTYTSLQITNGGTFTMSSGTLACTNILVGTTAPLLGYFIYNGGTITNLSAAGVSLNQYSGDVTLNASLNLNGSSVAIANSYQHTSGTLILNNYNLTVGSYSNQNSASNSPATDIQFGSGFIYVGMTAALQYCITINTVWNFINSGTGGFSFNMNVSRKIAVFTSVGSANAFNPLGDIFDSILDQAFNVFVTSGSSALTIDVNSRFRTLNFTGSSCTFVATGGSVYCQTLILGSAASYTGLPGLTGQIVMNGPGSITSNGKTLGKIDISQQINGYYITTLNDALACSDRITIISGIISTAYNITALYFLANSLSPHELRSTNNIYLTLTGNGSGAGSSGVFQGPLLISAGIVIYLTASTAKNFIGGGGGGGGNTANYPTLMNGGAGILTISGSNTFDTITNNVAPTGFSFTAGTTQTVTNFTVNGGGTGVNLVTLTSTAPGTQYSLSKSSGTVSVQYLSIRDSDATGGASWYAGVFSTNVSNNTGWFFTAVPPPSTNTGNFFLFF